MKPYIILIRPVNLLIMALMLVLVRYAIFEPVFRQNGLEGLMNGWPFLLLVIATLLIGAGGYVINDVLDVEIDQVNKPERKIINRYISDTRAKNLHFNLTAVGIAFGIAFSYFAGNLYLAVFFVIIPTALFYYSFKYKYMPLVGNLVVSLLAAMVVVIYWIFEFYHLKIRPEHFIEASRQFHLVNRLVLAFALFAFLTTLSREIIKDVADKEGDARFGCRTLPIAIGIPATRRVLFALAMITMAGLAWFQVILFRTGYSWMTWVLVITQLLLTYSIFRLIRAREKKDFIHLSLVYKLIMLAGMLSLIATWFRNL